MTARAGECLPSGIKKKGLTGSAYDLFPDESFAAAFRRRSMAAKSVRGRPRVPKNWALLTPDTFQSRYNFKSLVRVLLPGARPRSRFFFPRLAGCRWVCRCASLPPARRRPLRLRVRGVDSAIPLQPGLRPAARHGLQVYTSSGLSIPLMQRLNSTVPNSRIAGFFGTPSPHSVIPCHKRSTVSLAFNHNGDKGEVATRRRMSSKSARSSAIVAGGGDSTKRPTNEDLSGMAYPFVGPAGRGERKDRDRSPGRAAWPVASWPSRWSSITMGWSRWCGGSARSISTSWS